MLQSFLRKNFHRVLVLNEDFRVKSSINKRCDSMLGVNAVCLKSSKDKLPCLEHLLGAVSSSGPKQPPLL